MIDNKVRDPELSAFREQAAGLFDMFELAPMDVPALEQWYESHEAEIGEKLSTRRKNTIVLRALTRFTDDAHVEAIYEAMLAISISDKEYHTAESELIKSAASIWGFNRPPFKVMRDK